MTWAIPADAVPDDEGVQIEPLSEHVDHAYILVSKTLATLATQKGHLKNTIVFRFRVSFCVLSVVLAGRLFSLN